MTVRASAKPRHLKGAPPIRLGINIDHVATLRNARGGRNPDPVRAAKLAVEAGADNITAHLREDRRHITDEDIARLTAAKLAPLNLEMAVTEEMLSIALILYFRRTSSAEREGRETKDGNRDQILHRKFS